MQVIYKTEIERERQREREREWQRERQRERVAERERERERERESKSCMSLTITHRQTVLCQLLIVYSRQRNKLRTDARKLTSLDVFHPQS